MTTETAFIRSVTGRPIDLFAFTPDDVELTAIACGLSKVCRFAGQVEEFYSVAQHSVLVSCLVDRPFRAFGLLHDGSEAYIGDVSRNLKVSSAFRDYRLLECRVQNAVWDHFGLYYTDVIHEHVKAADDLAAVYERVVFRDRRTFDWHNVPAELLAAFDTGFVSDARRDEMLRIASRLPKRVMTGWSPATARKMFTEVFEDVSR